VGSGFLHASTPKVNVRRVMAGLTTISVIAPQPQISYTYIILADDDADYDERGVSANSSLLWTSAAQTLTSRFDNFLGPLRVRDIQQGKLCAIAQIVTLFCISSKAVHRIMSCCSVNMLYMKSQQLDDALNVEGAKDRRDMQIERKAETVGW
jgi:hypothetical protein